MNWRWLVGAFASLGLLGGCATEVVVADPVVISFDAATSSVVVFTNEGSQSAATAVSLVAAAGAVVTSVASLPGQGNRGRFPALDATASGPRAVISIRNTTAADVLNPGTRDFSFGADVMVDAQSESHAVGSYDDGNNVIQRGLFLDVAQFKLEVDNNAPNCRIKGDDGEAFVQGPTITPGSVVRLLCSRTATAVTLFVQPFNPDGSLGSAVASTANFVTGNLSFALATPMSVGGKLRNATTIEPSGSDQFNGTIDNAVLRY